MSEKQEAKTERIAIITKAAIEDVLSKYIGEPCCMRIALSIKEDVRCVMNNLHQEFLGQGLLAPVVSYLLFSTHISPGYYIDIKLGYYDVAVDLIETDWYN